MSALSCNYTAQNFFATLPDGENKMRKNFNEKISQYKQFPIYGIYLDTVYNKTTVVSWFVPDTLIHMQSFLTNKMTKSLSLLAEYYLNNDAIYFNSHNHNGH